MAGQYNITFKSGDRYKKKFRMRLSTDPDVYLDMTGFTGICQARVAADDPDPPVIEATVTFGSDITSWWVQILFAEADSEGIDGTYVYDLQLNSPTDGPFTYLEGALNITKDVSR